ncbi:MAG: hypothetical protein RR182_03585, partial [Alistipes sp.]
AKSEEQNRAGQNKTEQGKKIDPRACREVARSLDVLTLRPLDKLEDREFSSVPATSGLARGAYIVLNMEPATPLSSQRSVIV